MALATHHVQGSYTAFSRKPISRIKGMESKQYGITLSMLERTEKFISLQCKPYLRIKASHLQPKVKLLKISCFKGSSENEESSGKAVQSKSFQNSVKLSHVPQKSEEVLTESPKFKEGSVSSGSAVGDTSEGSQGIQNLFRSWLTLLRTPLPDQGVDKALGKPLSGNLSETRNGMEKTESGGILKAFWCFFLGLDAMIKIPLVIFIPSYLAVNVVYGAEVSKELTPLWVFGPLICALYIKMFRAICALYVYSFKQTVKVVKNLPTYYRVAYSYTAGGKLLQPVVNIKYLDYKEVLKGKMKDFSFWTGEKYLDFIESIWPYYCRVLRFLKRANLI